MSLTEQLQAYADQSAQKIPQPAQEIMRAGIDELVNNSILDKAFKTGQKIPQINLPNAVGQEINVNEELKNNKLVIAFYRGGWCPYCNLELKALQNALPEIEAKGAKLIAIAPEAPDNSLTTKEKNELSFEVLSDANNEVARELNLVYRLDDSLNELYKGFGIDLEANQNNTNQELPIAATYVVEQDGTISYHFLQEDYKLRADPSEILNAL